MTSSPYSTFTVNTNTPDQGGHLQKATQPWGDPSSFPKYGDASRISGNAPDFVKQLTNNAFGAYGVGDEECFGHSVGRATKFITIDIAERKDGGRAVLEARIVAEVVVTKDMLNGKGMTHGGCLAYLIDICSCSSLIALGIVQHKNGVGVTQNLNINFHAPAALGSCLRIISTSVTMGSRIMTSRCEIIDVISGRVIASALANVMQPQQVKL